MKKLFNKMFGRKMAVSMFTVVATGVLVSTTAFGAADSGVAVNGGTLSGGAITFGNFGDITLNGTQRTTSANWEIADIVDARGTGTGWGLTLNLSQFAEYDTNTSEYVTGGKTLPAGSLKVTEAPSVSLVDTTSSPANTITPIVDSESLDTGTPVKLLSAAIDGGMGSYSVSPLTATLTTRADAYAKTYKTDATVALVTGP